MRSEATPNPVCSPGVTTRSQAGWHVRSTVLSAPRLGMTGRDRDQCRVAATGTERLVGSDTAPRAQPLHLALLPIPVRPGRPGHPARVQDPGSRARGHVVPRTCVLAE